MKDFRVCLMLMLVFFVAGCVPNDSNEVIPEEQTVEVITQEFAVLEGEVVTRLYSGQSAVLASNERITCTTFAFNDNGLNTFSYIGLEITNQAPIIRGSADSLFMSVGGTIPTQVKFLDASADLLDPETGLPIVCIVTQFGLGTREYNERVLSPQTNVVDDGKNFFRLSVGEYAEVENSFSVRCFNHNGHTVFSTAGLTYGNYPEYPLQAASADAEYNVELGFLSGGDCYFKILEYRYH